MNQGKTTQIRCSNLGHLPQICANLLFFLSFSNRNYFLKKTFLQNPFYEKFSHAETHDSAKKPCRSTHSFSSSSNPEMVPKLPKIGTFLAGRTVQCTVRWVFFELQYSTARVVAFNKKYRKKIVPKVSYSIEVKQTVLFLGGGTQQSPM